MIAQTIAVRVAFGDVENFTACIMALASEGVLIEAGALLTVDGAAYAEFCLSAIPGFSREAVREALDRAMATTTVRYEVAPVLIVRLADEPQAFAMATSRLASSRLMRSMFAMAFSANTVTIAFGTDDPDAARALLLDLAVGDA
jgi:hypothetical protein